MRSSLEKSLQRLGTDYVDLYMAHNVKLPQYSDELFAELEKVKAEGRSRLGASAWARRSGGGRRGSTPF